MAELINAADPIDFPTGPAVGQPVPDFSLPDQFGNPCRFSETRANARALILFHRSASW